MNPMTILEAIDARHSVRAFTGAPIPQETRDALDACAAAGLPVAYYDTVVRCEVNGLTVGILSVDASYCSRETAEAYLRAGMADLNRDCDLIVACMHWGLNYLKDASAEEIDAMAKAFVEEFAPGFKERPFFVADFGHSQAYKDAIYKYSRLALA